MRKTKIIFNPSANRGRNVTPATAYRNQVAAYQYAVWTDTVSPGHATKLAEEAGRQGYDRVISIGGDGTLHEIINGLMSLSENQRPELAIFPIGSGNDFVRGALQNYAPGANIVHLFESDHITMIDVGYFGLNSSERRYWINALGIGFDAAVTLQSLRFKRLSGSAMYFVAAIRTIIENYDAPDMQIHIDDEQFHQHVQMLTIGNGTREGGGFITTPNSRIDDGWLDYAMFQPVSRAMMVRLLPEVMRGSHGKFREVRMGQLRNMSILSDRALLIHADGEIVARHEDNVRELHAGIVPNAIRLVR